MFPYRNERVISPFSPGPPGRSKLDHIRLLHEWMPKIQKTASYLQHYTPLVQQYLPFMKQLPMLIQMAKLMNEPDEEKEDPQKIEGIVEAGEEKKEKSASPRKRSGESKPKLFI
ncbi:VrrA/YqfQ family protein [Salimicrobium halophilum]|uniref:YqfQ-like protein n=1 Tax=Salimicrobium halophilum TaxID=86666 RepID=A0A1G8Q3E8_9BACI|nr:VrrA/YqfQ family protein [Salimicrobium halophilum]SDI99262.1 YqfQ-like protein [Salimicrobium halophilum]